MRVNYKVEQGCCKTSCLFKNGVMVGSVSCQCCQYLKMIDREKTSVECGYKQEEAEK
jgi:hypothetical protein